jgi:hypothetical protein
MRVCFPLAHSQACVDKEHTAISPWCQKPTPVGWRLVIGIVNLERLVDILQRWRSGCGWADREAEAVGLVGPVVGILARDDDLDSVERRVS